MPDYNSQHWNKELGVCTKHNLPEVPCPQCMAEGDEDVWIRFTDSEKESMWAGECSAADLVAPTFVGRYTKGDDNE